jgi:hypothetical protein
MSQKTVDQYIRWIIRHVRDETLRRLADGLRANYVTDPADPLHRGAYHHLLRAGVPEAALPAVLGLVIRSVERAVEMALWQEDQLRTTGHLRVQLLEVAKGDGPDRWVELSQDHLTFTSDPWADERGEIQTAADLDAVVRAPAPVTVEWDCPAGGCANCAGAERPTPG